LLDFAATLSEIDRQVAKALCLCSTPLKYDYLRRFIDYRILKHIKRQKSGFTVKKNYIVLKEFEHILEEHLDWLEPDLAILRFKILSDLETHQGLPKPTLHQWYPSDVDLVLGSLAQDNRLQSFNFFKARRLFSPFHLRLKRWEAQRIVKKHYRPVEFVPMNQLSFSFYLGVNRPYELLKVKQLTLDDYQEGARKYAQV
jgi:hypothetical protein